MKVWAAVRLFSCAFWILLGKNESSIESGFEDIRHSRTELFLGLLLSSLLAPAICCVDDDEEHG
jgi:hypothetical protein